MDLVATLRCRYEALLADGQPFILHPGETWRVERAGNGGVYVLTPAGEAFLPYGMFRWQEEHADCGPLCVEHGSPLDTSVDVVRLGLVRDTSAVR